MPCILPKDDAVVFIDANKYLDLYRTDSGSKLLAPLVEQAQFIFVTEQIVDEVARNKLEEAAKFLGQKAQGVKLQGVSVPDHFTGPGNKDEKEILGKMKEVSDAVKAINAQIDAFLSAIVAQVTESKDEISKALRPIFENAATPSHDELARARLRKETGNPPGKRNDPLGDQLSWEQLLSHFNGKRHLWIISRDRDYATTFNGRLFLNSALLQDVRQVAPDAEVHVFQDLVEGLTHFIETMKVEAKARLSPEEVEAIEEEERSLPPLDSQLNGAQTHQPLSPAEVSRLFADMPPYGDLSKLMEGMQPYGNLGKLLADMKPLGDLSKIMKPYGDLSKLLEGVQPYGNLSKLLADMKPLGDISKLMKPYRDWSQALGIDRPANLAASNSRSDSGEEE